MLSFFKDRGLLDDVCVLCFDGIMIPKQNEDLPLRECEEYIFEKTKIPVKLKIKPMTEGFDLPEVPEYVEYKSFDPKDDFTWLDFDEKWRGYVFKDYNEIIELTRTDLNRVFCRVEQGGGFIIKKTDCDENLYDILDRKTDFTDLYFKYDKKKMNFKQYIQEFGNHMNRYRAIDFAPNKDDPKLFNLWSGFKAEYGSRANIDIIKNHVKEVYCNNCEESYEFFLDILYKMLKYPEKPVGVATYICSKKHGAGKNIFTDFLQEYVFGNNITHYTTGLDSILEKHNAILKSKKIVVVDELASSTENWIGNFDKLKSMMTGNSLVINPKGVNQYSIKNVLGWFLISNHEDCIRIEPSDRRYFCLKVSEKYVGNKEYFEKLGSAMNQETGNAFYTYVMNRGDERGVIARTPPMNAFKKEIISYGWSSSMRFLWYLFECKKEGFMSGKKLYEKYTDWCNENHERVKSNNKFVSDIKDNVNKVRKTTGMEYDLSSIRM